MTKEKWLRSPWTIGFGTTIFGFLLTMINDYSKKEPILSTIWLIIKWTGNLVWKILDFDLKVWWIVLAFLFLVLILYIVDRFRETKMLQPEYREDRFKGWKWTWNWEFSTSRKAWILSDLKAHCPNCDTPMIEQSVSYQTQFDCPRCDFHSVNRPSDESFKIQRIIIDNIERKKNNP